MALSSDLKVSIASGALMPVLESSQCMIVMSIGGGVHVCYTFQVSNLSRSLMLEIAEDIQTKGDVTSIRSYAGYSSGTAVGNVVKVGQDDSVYNAVVRAVRNIKQHVLELENHTGWAACKDEIAFDLLATLYMDLLDYLDIYPVKDIQDLSGKLISMIKANCPSVIIKQGIRAILKYLKPVPAPRSQPGWQ